MCDEKFSATVAFRDNIGYSVQRMGWDMIDMVIHRIEVVVRVGTDTLNPPEIPRLSVTSFPQSTLSTSSRPQGHLTSHCGNTVIEHAF